MTQFSKQCITVCVVKLLLHIEKLDFLNVIYVLFCSLGNLLVPCFRALNARVKPYVVFYYIQARFKFDRQSCDNKMNVSIRGAPNGSVPQNICSYGISGWLAKKNEQINLLFIKFLTIYVKCYSN